MQYDDRGESVAQVYVALPQIRADRRKVRILTSSSFQAYTEVLPILPGHSTVQMLQDEGKQCCPVQDRVEASPEQLASAMAAAEKLSEQSGMRVRVIGWYHSHPHITVLPSHVDVATQASYQQLDAGFIGIIFSTFNQVRAPAEQSFVPR